VLWSDRAKQSDWVSLEFVTFQVTAKPRENPTRRLIFLNLQGMNKTMQAFQQVEVPALQAAYQAGGNVGDPLWENVMRRIEDGLNPQMRPLDVPLVVLTLTQAEVAAFDAVTWNDIKASFHVADGILRARYDAIREDWRPFRGKETIATVLGNVCNDVNDTLEGYRLSWKVPGEAFWTDIAAARAYVTGEFETAELSVLIVDPIALHVRRVYQRLMLFQNSLTRSRTVVVTLPPFAAPPRILRLRNALMNLGTPYFDDYFQPSVPPRRRLSAQCGWNVADTEDIKRLILAAAGQLAGDNEPKMASTYLRHGPR
jgi:hypothetical protein